MASTFNLLTAGGARFDKNRFKNDIELFTPKAAKKVGKPQAPASRKGKEKANDDDDDDDDASGASGSDEDGSDEEEDTRPAPPKQKITLSGLDPLPRSLHANLPSLTTHPSHPSTSHAGQPLLDALRASNIHSLWGVQCAVGGCLLVDRDVMCIAPTGSGKTLSYILPTLVRLGDPAREIRAAAGGSEGEDAEWKGIRSVVLVPTHDLAVQIHGVFKAVSAGRKWRGLVLSKATEHAVCESAPGRKFTGAKRAKKSERTSDDDEEETSEDDDEEMDSDAESTGSANEFTGDVGGDAPVTNALGIDLLIATPERLHHLLEQQLVSLARTRHLILDEADRLLSADFKPQVLPILAAASNPEVQKCFLSATMPSSSEQIAKKWLRDGGVRVVVGLKDSAVTTVSQSLLYTGSESGKLMALRNLIASGDLPYPSLIFVQSVARAEELHSTLVLDGLRVDSVHGNRTPAQRDAAIKAFREGTAFVLVVTEVLARGMDFRGVKVVINYVQSYIHRIGRTGRAGRPGKAITFFSNEDAPHLRTIANVLRASGCYVPEYMLDMKKPSKNPKKFRAQVPVKRKEIGGGGRDVGREKSRKKRDMILASKRRKGAVGGPDDANGTEGAKKADK